MTHAKRKPSRPGAGPDPRGASRRPVGLRIIGGRFRGRKLHYSGDFRTRPMKDRLREAIFNLIGPSVVGKHAIDLFAGTGALGLEALSRGAGRATFFELHRPTADTIRRNVAELGVEASSEIVAGDVFIWAPRLPDRDRPTNSLGTVPVFAQGTVPIFAQGTVPIFAQRKWDCPPPTSRLVFCSPPYAFYVDRQEEMLGLLGRLIELSPPESTFVVEADERFDFGLLPERQSWDVRRYPPAVVGIYRKQGAPARPPSA